MVEDALGAEGAAERGVERGGVELPRHGLRGRVVHLGRVGVGVRVGVRVGVKVRDGVRVRVIGLTLTLTTPTLTTLTVTTLTLTLTRCSSP